jgi:hypothetical protein
MPKFGWTTRAGRESSLPEPVSDWQPGQADGGMWVDIVSAPTPNEATLGTGVGH